jgi:DNA-binding IclR family transcriptional regulator
VSVPTQAAGTGLLEKGLAVLQLVAERGSVAVAEVAGEVGLSRSSAYRLVDRLRSGGYLQESRAAGAFRLGPRAVPIGLAALNQLDMMDVAPARLRALAADAGETVNLAVPLGDEMVYVYQAEGPGAVKVTAHLGTRRPLNCSALGKAFLAALPDDERVDRVERLLLVRVTPGSIVGRAALRAELGATVARGYSVDAEEAEEGVACVGAAIRDYSGQPVAAISIAGPAERMPPKQDTLVPLLLAAAADVSARLGYIA